MKTVQEYLLKADEKKLIHEYICRYPMQLHQICEWESTIGDKIKEYVAQLQEFINKLKTMERIPCEKNQTYVLFAHKDLQNGVAKAVYSMACLEEILEEEEEAELYSYVFTKQEEVMGYLVSNAPYTQENIYGLLVDVLYETSFFGYDQEGVEEEKENIVDRVEAFQEGKGVSYSLEEIREKMGFPKEKRDLYEDTLRKKVVRADNEYYQYCKGKAFRETIEYMSQEVEL